MNNKDFDKLANSAVFLKTFDNLLYQKVYSKYEMAQEELKFLDIDTIKDFCNSNGLDFAYNDYMHTIVFTSSAPMFLNKLKIICKKMIIDFDDMNPDGILISINELKEMFKLEDRINGKEERR